MNTKSNFNFNPKIYEDELSSFGKKVLNTLIQQWQTKSESKTVETEYFHRNSKKNNSTQGSTSNFRNKKTINFHDSEDVIGSNELFSLPCHKQAENICSKNNIFFNDPKPKYSPIESLLLPIEINDPFVYPDLSNQESEPYSTSKKVTSDLAHNISESLDFPVHFDENKFEPDILKDKDFGMSYLNDGVRTTNYNATNKSDNEEIVWNDIVDTQLFDNKQLVSEKEGILKTPVISNENLLMRLPDNEDMIMKSKGKSNPKNKKKHSNENTLGSKKSACKRKCTKITDSVPKQITDSIPKKIKKPKNSVMAYPKNIQKKQKYTTSVQNWLDEVDPENPVEDDLREDATTTTMNKEKMYKIELKSNKQTCSKKVVQAQLANKDGVMKYDKPKIDKQIDSNNETKIVTETKVIKDKKCKPKFVAPIKSQVPVKDIVYDIYNIDCNSVITRSADLRIRDSEVFMVLTYSNGFNQLNSQFTEDVCLPEAMMLLINENYYFLKGKDFNIMDDIAALMKNNTVFCYGGKSVLKYLAFNFNIDVYKVNALDTKIGGSLMDPDNPPENFSNLQSLLGLTFQYTIATDCALQKAAWYLTLMKDCTPRLTSMLKENSLWKVFVDIEIAVMPIIASMEMRGIIVDSDKLKSMEATILNKMKKTEQECYKAAGKKFQINSTVQVRSILYDELQLDTKSNVKIKETMCQGAKSTSETMLRSLIAIHPLPKLILDYRQLHKAHATFLVGISQHVKDGILRPTWEQTAAATGRIAANNPNIQAIPKAEINLNELTGGGDDEDAGPQHLNFRSIYTSRPGFVLLAADFNHVECRVFAHAAADEGLLELLATGRDLFRVLAAKWLNKPEESITSEDRERTKRIVYASLYGAGARKLTDILGVSYDQALTVFTSFNRTFPSLKSFGRSVVARCSRDGGSLSTLCGRVRRFANIDSTDVTLKAQAERQAVNFIVQGSAADLCKLAMVGTVQRLRAAGLEAHLLLQIHDELVWEIRQEQLDVAAGIIKSSMEGCGASAGAGGTLPVSLHAGHCWGNMSIYTMP